MTWTAHKRDSVTAHDIYGISREHRLEWHNLDAFVGVCKAAAAACELYDIRTEDGEDVGVVLVSGIMDGESASFEMIPYPQFLTGEYGADVRHAVIPILDGVFTQYRVRSVTSAVPYSRIRTRRALKKCGFVQKCKLEEGVHLRGFSPEDLYIFQMTARKFRETKHGMA